MLNRHECSCTPITQLQQLSTHDWFCLTCFSPFSYMCPLFWVIFRANYRYDHFCPKYFSVSRPILFIEVIVPISKRRTQGKRQVSCPKPWCNKVVQRQSSFSHSLNHHPLSLIALPQVDVA